MKFVLSLAALAVGVNAAPKVTHKCFFDVEIAGEPAGR
jgi:hypothetical protein